MVKLPTYAKALATNFTVQCTPIGQARDLCATEVDASGAFQVLGDEGDFFWTVYGERCAVDVEPLRSEVEMHGSGPYRWLEHV
jgi:hypothetical protein